MAVAGHDHRPGGADREADRADFVETLRQTVVVRGTDPLPVREPIPLRLPLDVAEQIAAEQMPE